MALPTRLAPVYPVTWQELVSGRRTGQYVKAALMGLLAVVIVGLLAIGDYEPTAVISMVLVLVFVVVSGLLMLPRPPGRRPPTIMTLDDGSSALLFKRSLTMPLMIFLPIGVMCLFVLVAYRQSWVTPEPIGFLFLGLGLVGSVWTLMRRVQRPDLYGVVVSAAGVTITNQPFLPWSEVSGVDPVEGRYLSSARNRGQRVARIDLPGGGLVSHQILCNDLNTHPAVLLTLLTWIHEDREVADLIGTPHLTAMLDEISVWALRRDSGEEA